MSNKNDHKDTQLFYEIIEIALGNKDELSRTPTNQEWVDIFELSQEQTVVGVVFLALEKLSKRDVKPPLKLLYEWIGLNEQIRVQNLLVNKRCVELTIFFAEAGFRTCILKGQGNALMYPAPLSRTSGDIDIWVEGKRDEIRELVVSRCPEAQDGDMHIDFSIFKDVAVEVHYTPRVDVRPKYNKRLQQWICDSKDVQFANMAVLDSEKTYKVCVPTAEFNVILQMSHLMGHFFVEGIGLRQFIDFFYLLQQKGIAVHKTDLRETLTYLGMDKFAGGVMWVLHEKLGLDCKYLLCEPNEQVGILVLKEIEEGGNFGHFDQRFALRKYGLIGRGVSDFYRLATLMRYFPSFALWKMWDKIKGQRWKV